MIDPEFLASIPFFNFLTRQELQAAIPSFREVAYAKDDVVCTIGEPGDTFFLVLEGELSVWDAGTPPKQTGSLRAGDYFGEMALLQGGRRTATVTVTRRARLLAVDKPTFDRLFLHNPRAIEYFARELSKRLAGVTRGERIHRATTTVAVASPRGLRGETLVSFSLAMILKELTGTDVAYVEIAPGTDPESPLVLDVVDPGLQQELRRAAGDAPGALPAVFKISVALGRDTAWYGEAVARLISRLSGAFSFVVMDLGSKCRPLIESAPDYSDVFVSLVDTADEDCGIASPRAMTIWRVVNLYNPTSRPLPINASDPFVIPYAVALEVSAIEAALHIRAHPRSAGALPLYRLARKLLGTSIGLALGGGAAFGLAHLGVLQVLEADGIPVDLVAGCSQGSIVAIGYAAGLGVQEMIEIARTLGARRNFLLASDPAFLTRPGILSGRRFLTMLRPYLRGKETFDQLHLPCQTVATDIQSGERVAIGSGLLETAFRASSSVPMVMAPIMVGDRVLVDGGVVDPVPAEITSRMGADITVAVNVVPRMKRGVETAMSAWYRRANVLNPFTYLSPDAQEMPNMFDIIMNSMQILQYELGNFKAISADVLINPDLSDFTWIEYYRADELIARGAEAAERALPAIHKAIDRKLGPIRATAASHTR